MASRRDMVADSETRAQAKPRLVWQRVRNVGAVFAGLALTIALMIGSNLLIIRFIAATSITYLLVTLLAAWVFHFVGGHLCAAIAQDNVYSVIGIVLLGAAVMGESVANTWSIMPPWYSVAMLIIAPVALFLGTVVHAARRRRQQS